MWWCFCGGVFVAVFSWWCGSVFVVVFVWWCLCAGVFVLVFLWWCFCGGVFVVVFLWCGCGGVLVVVFLWRCFCGGVLVVVYKVLLQQYKVLLRTTKYYSSTLQYYSVLQSTTQYYSVLQSTTPTSETTSERRPSSTTPYYASTTKASKTSISCEASATFQGTSFQKERFVRGFFQISQNKLPKRAFRTTLPTILQEIASKMIVSCEASSKFHRTSFQNERFARCFRQFSRKICVSLQFRAIDTPLPARGFIRQKQNVLRTTTPCIPNCDNVRFATAPCTKMYESIHREPTRFAHTKM